VRRLAVVLALAAVFAACGTTAAVRTPIVFGITGGNIAPYRITIQPNGTIEIRVSIGDNPRRKLSHARVRQLTNEIRQAHLESRTCPGVLPDLASRYIRVDGHTVTVHGACEPKFRRVWSDLFRATGTPSRS
jgi:hypothetical protein